MCWYEKPNQNFMLKKKGHNFLRINDRVMSSCLEVGMMVANKFLKFQSNTSKGIGNKYGETKILCRKRCIIFSKSKTVMSFCLEVGMMITNKYSKFQSNTSKGI